MTKKHFVAIITVVIMLVVTQFTFAQAEHQPSDIVTFAWSQTGTQLAVGQWDGAVRVWNVQQDTFMSVLPPTPLGVNALAWSPDEKFIASVRWNNLAISNLVTHEHFEIDTETDYSVLWTSQGIVIGTAGIGGLEFLRVFDPSTGQIQLMLDSAKITAINNFSLSNNQKQVAIISNVGGVFVWDANFSEQQARTQSVSGDVYHAGGWAVTWNQEGTKIATGHENGLVKVWDVANLQESSIIPLVWEQNAQLSETLGYNMSSIRAVAFSTDGSEVFSIAADGTLRTWDTQTGQLLRDIQLGESIYAAAFSPDSSQLAIGGSVTQMTLIPAHIYDPAVIPTPTPTATFTPTSTSTPTLTLTPSLTLTLPAKFDRLRLSPACSPDPATIRVWRVRNLNPFDFPFTWEVQGNREQGSGVAPANGEVTFTTKTIHPTANVVRIFVQGKVQDVSTSTSTQCPTPTPGG
ncbi:putative serine/threonine-protein kinase PkwA [Anaerolineae bacterium]|nr:putative serine/threonine-protein kinase PkwA [Anaerolineae bacterium]